MSFDETVNAAIRLLEVLESGVELPLPYMMRRIKDQLVKRYTETPFESEPVEKEPERYLVSKGHNEKDLLRFYEDVEKFEETTPGPLYADVQFLVTKSGGFVFKEFAIGCASTVAWVVVRPVDALPDKSQNSIVKNNINGLEWDGGAIDVEGLRLLTARLFNGQRPVYVKGRCKAKALHNQLRVPGDRLKEVASVQKLQLLRDSVHYKEKCWFHLNRNYHLACARWHVKAVIENCHL